MIKWDRSANVEAVTGSVNFEAIAPATNVWAVAVIPVL